MVASLSEEYLTAKTVILQNWNRQNNYNLPNQQEELIVVEIRTEPNNRKVSLLKTIQPES